ncbi:MAG TPA: dephospho-CoA kinase [Peptococcaceae bacterium]|nr:dephospho-CoA kinase [Peptococcaceae bacterium]
MKVIGLTGGIASGKSMVAGRLMQLGAQIIDADVIARQLTEPGSEALQEIRRIFGSQYLDEQGHLRRKALGSLIFSDSSQREKLDELMGPRIRQEICRQLMQASLEGAAVLILVAPLLLEAGLEDLVDEIWVVALDRESQIKRLMQRDQLTEAQAQERLASQSSLAEKLGKATRVIDNRGDLLAAEQQIDALWKGVQGHGSN